MDRAHQLQAPADGMLEIANNAVTAYAILNAGGANVLELVNSTAAQTWNIYNTSNGANYEAWP